MLYPLRYHGHSRGDWDTSDVIFIGIIVIIFIIASLFTHKLIVSRKLKKAPLRRLADFEDGETAKIVGRVEFVDECIEAPLSGRKCSWYYVLVQKHNSNSTRTLIKEERKCTFVLRDGDKWLILMMILLKVILLSIKTITREQM